MERDCCDLKSLLLERINLGGGFVNTHAHLDRAYTITSSDLELANCHLHEKWKLVDPVRAQSSVDEIYRRMVRGVERMIEQGISAVGTFIDVDDVVEDKVILAAQKLRDEYKKDIDLIFINQTLKGVLEPKARFWFDEGAKFVDILGGLPGKDKGREAYHLDVVLGTARQMGKMVHVHVDQQNLPWEQETELLAQKTKEHGMEGKVIAIHGISIAAHPAEYRCNLYQMMKEVEMSLVCCPTAWIDGQRSEVISVTHNSIAPVEEMVGVGITVALGTDNIMDLYKPFTDGDMWTELHLLLDACRFYDLDKLVEIASSNGRKVLGLPEQRVGEDKKEMAKGLLERYSKLTEKIGGDKNRY